MGGSIAVTIREKNGKEHRMTRWTNPTPYFVNNPKLCDKDMAYLAEYLKHTDPKEDKFLAPSEYGIVVIDMMKDVILDMNGYTEYGTMCDAGVRLELQYPESSGFTPTNVLDPETMSHVSSLKVFAERGRVVELRRYNKKPISFRGKTFDEIKKRLLTRVDFGKIVLDMSPFKVKRFEESHEGAMKMRERVLELGFVLSKKEQKIWDKWRNGDED